MEKNILINLIVDLIDNKRASDIISLDVSKKTTLADQFIICSADSTVQVKAIADEVFSVLKRDYNLVPLRTEGLDSAKWAILDYGNVWLHVFYKEEREFYDIDSFWENMQENYHG